MTQLSGYLSWVGSIESGVSNVAGDSEDMR